MTIEILLKSGDVIHYNPAQFTDYKYDGKAFIVIKDCRWIGIYNWDNVAYVEVYENE